MNPSASAIRDAVEKLKKSPGVFQRLAERYAQATFSLRFRELVPKGRNPEDVAVKGWPDAYAVLPDGRLDAIEVTHSPDWERHLDQDCEKAGRLGRGRLAGFLFVAWASTPSTEKVNECRDRFVKLGVPADRVKFVFRDELVAALTRPQFADVWVELLGLRCESLPFHPIRRVRRLFGREDQIATFAPTMPEYVDGKVHRPRLADEVERQLQRPGWAFVRGLGAAGKTVLATQTALGPVFGASPAYYCDLASVESDTADPTASAALEAITTRADDGVLFVVDNVHVNEAFARTLFDHWETFPNGSKMLLLGRLVSAGADVRGRGSSLDDLEGNALVLQVAPEDLEGVYLRLAQRRVCDSTGILPPSADVLQGWSRLFGGDLIAFSAAVARRIDDLLRGWWRLRPEDAIDYVHDVYLAPLTEAECRNLLIVATLSRIEFDTPANALEKGSLKMPLRQGVVHRTEHGRDRHVRFHLVHPGLGDLLLAAHGSRIDELTVFRHVVHANPIDGQRLAARLENVGRSNDLVELLAAIAETQGLLAKSLLQGSLGFVTRNVERLARLEVCDESQVDNCLVGDESALASAALRTPLGALASFLGYAEGKLPQVHGQLSASLAESDNLKSLTETALRTPLGDLAPFLGYAKGKLPQVHRQLSASLAQPDNLKSLTETALRTPLDALASFLGFAEGKLPHVHRQLSTALAEPDNLKPLTETALRTPLEHLTHFLDYAKRKLPQVHRRLSTALAEPDNLKSLTETALRTPLGHLAHFLGFAEGKLPQVHRQLSASLAEPDNLKSLTETALRTPLDQLAKFLGYASGKLPQVHRQLSTALAEPDNLKSLTETALRTPLGELASFLGYAEGKLPQMHRQLSALLAEPDNLKSMTETALRTPLAHLAKFLGYAEGKLPQVHRQLSTALAEPDNLKPLTERALRTPLGDLASFLGYAARKLPQVHRRLSLALAEPDNLRLLTERALRTPLGDLTSFLSYAEGKLPHVHQQLSTALAEPDNLKSLTETALRTPLDTLASFLGYAGQKLKKLYGPLTGNLAQPANIKQLAKAACECQPDSLVRFIRATGFASAVVEAIDANVWEQAWRSMKPKQPDFIGAIDRELCRLGCPELAIAPAQALIRAAEPSDWHAPGIGIVHLSHTLRLGRAVGEQEVHCFLDRVVDDAWLDQQYRDSIPGAIGAALLSIWTFHEQTVVSCFCRPTLASRIAGLLKHLPTATVEDTCQVLQLWGTSGVIGLDVAVNAVQWLGEVRIGEVIEFARPEEECLDIRSVQLWLGLRRMARFGSPSIAVSGTSGHQILTLWKCATDETERRRRLNQWMIDWLERCAAADWRLLPDNSTLK